MNQATVNMIVYLCVFGPWALALLCFAFPASTWLAADKRRWWWVAMMAIPLVGLFIAFAFLVGPLPALLRAKSQPSAHVEGSGSRTIFSDD